MIKQLLSAALVSTLLLPSFAFALTSNAVSGEYDTQAVAVYCPTGLISTGASTTQTRSYPLTDAQGSVRFLTNASGTVINSFSFTPFGSVATTSATASTSPYLYTGENLDTETGLQYNRARYYDPATARFISRDSIAGNQENPITQNPFWTRYSCASALP